MCLRVISKLYRRLNLVHKAIFYDDNENDVEKVRFIEINAESKSTEIYYYPKIIWMYWDEIQPPELVELCFERVKKLCPDFTVHLLNKSTINNFIDIGIIDNNLPKAIIADLIRLKLLAKFGGVWIDSSVILLNDLGWAIDIINNHSAFLFYSDECTLNFEKPISENWFIIAPLNSGFISEWLYEFESCIKSNSPLEYYKDISGDKGMIQNLTRPDYLLCYISAIVVLEKRKHNIMYASSASVGHYYNYRFNFNPLPIALCLCFKSDSKFKRLNLIKLTSGGREKVSGFMRFGFYRKNTIIGKLNSF